MDTYLYHFTFGHIELLSSKIFGTSSSCDQLNSLELFAQHCSCQKLLGGISDKVDYHQHNNAKRNYALMPEEGTSNNETKAQRNKTQVLLKH